MSRITERLARLRRRLTVATLLFGVGTLVAVVGGGAVVVGFLDWLVHLDDAGIRCLLAVLLFLAGAFVVGRWLWWPLRRRRSDTALALEVERRHPGLRDGFASTVAFVESGCDPTLGSPALQQRTIEETERRIARLDLGKIVPLRPARTAAFAGIGVCALIAVLAAVRPVETGTAVRRLALPFSAPDWPRTTRLRFVDEQLAPVPLDPEHPLRRARGATLELYVVNTLGELPRNVELETRIGDERAAIETTRLRQIVVRDEAGAPREVYKLVLPIDRGPLAFRVVGGDDRDREFQPVEVVPPPAIASLRVTVHPPEYTGEPQRSLPDGLGHVSALVGTRVDVAAETNRAVRTVRLHVKDRTEPIALAEDGRSFSTSFVVRDSGVHSYWFQLVDHEDIENARATRYEIRGREDAVPTVTIEEPAVDRRVTPRARVPLRIVAKDDLGLVGLERVSRIERTGDANPTPHREVLWSGSSLDRVAFDESWNLADLRVAPGDRVLLTAEARDGFRSAPVEMPGDDGAEDSVSAEPAGHVGRSLVRTLIVVTDAEKLREATTIEGTLADELDRIAEEWRSARDRTGELLVQRRTVGRLRDADLDALESIELDQRRASGRLVDPIDGVLSRGESLLRELADNDVDDREIRRNVEAIVDELRFLEEGELGRVASALTTARKRATTESRPPSERDDPLAEAHDGQTRIAATLDELLGKLTTSHDRRELEQDLDELLAGQRELRDRTAGMLNRTIGRDVDDLPEQDRAELGKIAARQRTRAEETDRLRRRLEAAARNVDPEATETDDVVGDAADSLAERGAAGAMDSAANLVDRNDVGRALAEQDRAIDALEATRSTLENRAVNDSETLVEELRRAEEELESIREERAEILQKTRDAERESDPAVREERLEKLEKERRDLRERTARLSRRLGRLRARSAGAAARRAVDRMDDVERLLKENADERAEELEREILDELEQAIRDAGETRRNAEERLARELLESVGGELAGFVERERSIIVETERLRDILAERGSLKRSQAATLRRLADAQRALGGDVEGVATRLAAAEVFVLVLQGAAGDMRRVADRLDGRDADDRTIEIAREAIARIETLTAVLERTDDAPAPEAPGGGGENGPNGEPEPRGPQSLVSVIDQLRVLKAIQEQLLERTERLDESRGDDGRSEAEVRTELAAIATEQERVADLARSLVEKVAGPANDPPRIEEPDDE